MSARLKALSKPISDALGKQVVETHGSNEAEIELELDEDADNGDDEEATSM